MKFKFFCLGLFIFQIAPQLSSAAREITVESLCKEKSALMTRAGKKVENCKASYFGSALTADYQPKNVGALTQKNSVKKSKSSPYYVLKNYSIPSRENRESLFSDQYESLSLLDKFAEEVRISVPEDTGLYQYIARSLKDANSKISSAEDFVGSCHIWAAWSLDPEVQEMMSKIKDGLFCKGIPFTRGELKELITAVYPNPVEDFTNQDLKGYYDPNKGGPNYSIPSKDVEDANLALVGLGDFGAGSGEFRPENIVQMAIEANKNGNRLIMDLNPGTREIWNQPIEAVVDVSFTDATLEYYNRNQYLNAGDLSFNTNEGEEILKLIANAEADLKAKALEGNSRVSDCLLDLKKAVGITVSSRSRDKFQPLTDQVDELKAIQRKLLQRKILSFDREKTRVVKHRLFIQYATEGSFAQDDEEPARTRRLDYVTVGNGETKSSRSFWAPPTRRLTQVCDNYGKLEENSLLLSRRVNGRDYRFVASSEDLKKECKDLKAGDKGRKIVVGAFPPKVFKIFNLKTGNKRFKSKNYDYQKRMAYEHLKEMIKRCEKDGKPDFHNAALFVQHLKNFISTNSGTDSESVRKLAEEYQKNKDFLNLKSVQITIEQVYESLPNLDKSGRDLAVSSLIAALGSTSA